jgi:hypothetical protein
MHQKHTQPFESTFEVLCPVYIVTNLGDSYA